MGNSFLFRSKGWPEATVFNPDLQERVPGKAKHPCSSGTSAHRKGQEINHVLGEAAAKHAVNKNRGNSHQVDRR